MRAIDRGALDSLRTALEASGYTGDAIAEPRRLAAFLPLGDEIAIPASLRNGDGRLSALVKLLALGRRVPVVQAQRALGSAVLEPLQAMGLVSLEGDEAVANYRVVPHNGLLLAGDGLRPDARDQVAPLTNSSLSLAQLTPRRPVRSMLDLGTGSGIHALLAANHCQTVTAVDVNPRAVMLAEFNASLNGVDNFRVLRGSWLEPVDEDRFDLIVSNPPYVVSPDDDFTYRDSGLPAGALMERLCRESAAHLEAGGLAILLASWPHTSEEDWSVVPTAWVQDTGCDALVLCSATVDRLDYAVGWNTPPSRYLDPGSLREAIGRWLRYYGRTGVGAISFGAVVLRRKSTGRPWLSTLRASTAAGGLASQQLLRLIDAMDLLASLGGDDRALLARRFSLAEGIDISQRFQRREGRFAARPAMVKLVNGLGVSGTVDPDALEVVFACDGLKTVSEIVRRVAARRSVDADALSHLAAIAVRELLAHGLLS